MKQKDKKLLLKDLSARVPYGVKVDCKWKTPAPNNTYGMICTLDSFLLDQIYNVDDIDVPFDEFKPYLYPLSSMTKEQYKEWCDLEAEPLEEILTRNANCEKMSTLEHHLLIAKSLIDSVNYCYKNHFDIYGLISMGLAIDASGLNIY